MSKTQIETDVAAIRKLIADQFAAIGWSPERPADWDRFRATFLEDASLYPAARPVSPKSVAAFVERMQGLAGGSLPTFHERALGADILVFGNVAVAMAGCEITENAERVTRGVEAILLVRTAAGEWKVAAQAWDMEGDGKPFPAGLASPA